MAIEDDEQPTLYDDGEKASDVSGDVVFKIFDQVGDDLTGRVTESWKGDHIPASMKVHMEGLRQLSVVHVVVWLRQEFENFSQPRFVVQIRNGSPSFESALDVEQQQPTRLKA